MVRYPHSGVLKWSGTTVVDADGNPIVTVEMKELFECRVQLAQGKKNLDYSAKVFCKILEFEPWQLENATFIYDGRKFKVTQLFNYQKHCEIWLE